MLVLSGGVVATALGRGPLTKGCSAVLAPSVRELSLNREVSLASSSLLCWLDGGRLPRGRLTNWPSYRMSAVIEGIRPSSLTASWLALCVCAGPSGPYSVS